MKKLWVTFLKEYFYALIAATIWVAIDIYTKGGKLELVSIVERFGTAFFLVGWLSGNLNRIKKQQYVESSFIKIEGRLEMLIDHFEVKTNDVISNITGGDSFCYIEIARNVGWYVLNLNGNHAMHDISIRVADADYIDSLKDGEPYEFGTHDLLAKVELITPGISRDTKLRSDMLSLSKIRKNIQFFARNGHFDQILRMVLKNNEWLYATRVIKDGGVIYEFIDPAYPTQELLTDKAWNRLSQARPDLEAAPHSTVG